MKNKVDEMKKDIHTVLLHNCKYDYCEGVLVGFNEEGIARELYDEGYRKQEWISVEERCMDYENTLDSTCMDYENTLDFIHGGMICDIFKHAADVVEVVRCKDCKYAKPMSFKGYFMCKRHHKYCRKSDDFCSYGKRKGGAE